MIRTVALMLTALLLLTAIAACGGKTPAEIEAQPTAASVQQPAEQPKATEAAIAPGSTQAPDPTKETEPTEAAIAPTATQAPAPTTEAEPTEETAALDDWEVGLDTLKSYRLKWNTTFTMTEDGVTESMSYEMTREVTTDPEATRLVMKVTSSEEQQSGDLEMVQIGDTVYYLSERDGEPECMAMGGEAMNQALSEAWTPGVFGKVEGMRAAGRETVNGIPARKYVFTEKALATGAVKKLSGEVWLAVDGGYVVKENVSWEGAGSLTGQGADALSDGTWAMEIYDVNEPFEIVIPEGCSQPAGTDLPVMPDATEKMLLDNMVSYETASEIADVISFYEKEMPAAGWTEGEGRMIADDYAQMNFTRDGETAQLMMSRSEGTTSVIITLSTE